MAKRVISRSKTPANWETHPTLTGVVVGLEQVNVDGRDTGTMLLDDGEKVWQIFESAMLRDAFELARPGMHFTVTCTGTKDAKGGKNKLRLFEYELWEDTDAPTPEASAAPRRRKGRK